MNLQMPSFGRLSFKKWTSYILSLDNTLPFYSSETLFTELLFASALKIHTINYPNGYIGAADPHFQSSGLIFFEGICGSSGKGTIFQHSLDSGISSKLNLDHGHYSFPFMFEANNSKYMLFECSEPPFPSLYSCFYSSDDSFIYNKVQIKNPLQSRILDPVILKHHQDLYTILGTYNSRPYQIQPLCDLEFISHSVCILRPSSMPLFTIPGRFAGSPIYYDDTTFLPVQTSKYSYGDGIQFFELDIDSGSIKPRLLITSFNRSPYGPHTISFDLNSNFRLCALDLCFPTYSLQYLLPKTFHYLRNL